MNRRTPEKSRILHLLKLGIFASLLVLAGDMILGWGVSDLSAREVPQFLTRYLHVSDPRIIASAMLGLFGIPVECLSWSALVRMIRPYSEKDAHAFRAGMIGCLVFGACGVHVPCCMAVFLLKRFYANDPMLAGAEMMRFLVWFLLPALILFSIFFFWMVFTLAFAIGRGHSPLPRWCWIFSILFGLILSVILRCSGDHAFTNALSTGWISLGNLWMMTGILIQAEKVL